MKCFDFLLQIIYINFLSINLISANGRDYSTSKDLIWADFFSSAFEMSSVLHVTLLILLKLLAILKPESYRKLQRKIRNISITIIWSLSLVVHLSKTISAACIDEKFGQIQYLSITIVFKLLPIISILLMDLFLIWNLRKISTQTSDATGSSQKSIEKAMTLVVQRIVVALLICYGLSVSWRLYFLTSAYGRDLTKTEVLFISGIECFKNI